LPIRHSGPAPPSKPVAPPPSLALSGKPGKPAKPVISPPKPPRWKHLPITVDKGYSRPYGEQAFNKNVYCFSCGERGKVRCNKWFPVTSGDCAPGVFLGVEYHQGFCDGCWPYVGKPVISGDLSGVLGEWAWVATIRSFKKC